MFLWAAVAATLLASESAVESLITSDAIAVVSTLPRLRLSIAPELPRLNAVHTGGQTSRSRVITFGTEGSLDLSAKRGRLLLGDDAGGLLLHFDWRPGLDASAFNLHSQIHVAFFGRSFALTPPQIRLCSRAGGGGTDIIFHMPLIDQRF
jgi:hypothetical protein